MILCSQHYGITTEVREGEDDQRDILKITMMARRRWAAARLRGLAASRQHSFDALPEPSPPPLAGQTFHKCLDLGVPFTGFDLHRYRIPLLDGHGHMAVAARKMQG